MNVRSARGAAALSVAALALAAAPGCGTATTRAETAGVRSATTSGLRVPVRMLSVGGSLKPLVKVSVAGGPAVLVTLDTGSRGLLLDSAAIGPSARRTGGSVSKQYLGLALTGDQMTAGVSIGGATTTAPVRVAAIRDLDSTGWPLAAQGVRGILGVAPGRDAQLDSPLDTLPAPLPEGFTIAVRRTGGTLTLGKPVRTPASTVLPLAGGAAGVPGKFVDLCWRVATASACGRTSMDTGGPQGFIVSTFLPGAPSDHGRIALGTTVTARTPGGRLVWRYTTAAPPDGIDPRYVSPFGAVSVNTGIPFYLSHSVGYDLTSGSAVITPNG